MVTFIWYFAIIFAYNVVLIVGAILLDQIDVIGPLSLIAFATAYLIEFLYITIIWHVVTVVSVLEESYGINAMTKSQDLIKGKMGVAFAVFMVIGVCFFAIQLMFEMLVVQE
ncbi:uncharacterized protein LOC121751799 [Salvia splendens]|uniref:uncharacterized protein LOC121751799 n=1 Tax=Salvia splendens TaxID=180675 RepID=UPI001C26A15E|nr:uncharacterized protein LOC121751799 [Salvia splendens]